MVYSINKSALLEEAYDLLEEAGKGSIKKDRYKKKDEKFAEIKKSDEFKETKAANPKAVATTKPSPMKVDSSSRGGVPSIVAGLGKKKADEEEAKKSKKEEPKTEAPKSRSNSMKKILAAIGGTAAVGAAAATMND